MKKHAKTIFYILFLLYISGVSAVLFFCRKSDFQIPIKEYFAYYANGKPLKTLLRYLRYVCIRRDAESICLALFNIGGNLVLFLPMGFFLPCLFRALRRFDNALCVMTFAVISSELLQGFFRLGIPDTDDVLMNLLGASLGFCMAKRLRFCEKILS